MLDFVYFGMVSLLALVGVGAYFWSSRRASVKTLPFMVTVSAMLSVLFGVFWASMFVLSAGPTDAYVDVVPVLVVGFLVLIGLFVVVGSLWVSRSRVVVFWKGAVAMIAVSGIVCVGHWGGLASMLSEFV
jgi:hypothetical protein